MYSDNYLKENKNKILYNLIYDITERKINEDDFLLIKKLKKLNPNILYIDKDKFGSYHEISTIELSFNYSLKYKDIDITNLLIKDIGKLYHDSIYVGAFYNNQPHGNGCMIYNPGHGHSSRYIGNFVNNKRNGYGNMLFNYGYQEGINEYSGEWDNDQMNGSGKYIDENDNIYYGQWCNNCFNGIGLYKYGSNGFDYEYVYKGQWINDKKSGLGIIINIDEKNLFIGNWINNEKHGKGLWKKINIDDFDDFYIDVDNYINNQYKTINQLNDHLNNFNNFNYDKIQEWNHGELINDFTKKKINKSANNISLFREPTTHHQDH